MTTFNHQTRLAQVSLHVQAALTATVLFAFLIAAAAFAVAVC